jgi:electron transfer flavoprotein beta subunit
VDTAWCSEMDNEPDGQSPQIIYVLMKWVGLRPEVDSITGNVHSDDRFAGASLADRAALETALRFASVTHDVVRVLCVGPLQAEMMLREAVACGASSAVLFATSSAGESATSPSVAECLAAHCTNTAMVFCGDWSLDRGSGSVPPLVAHHLAIGQACGLVRVRIDQVSGIIDAERRLDGGRRELLRVDGPSVLSVEGSVATLRRATISGVLQAKSAVIEHRSFTGATHQLGVRIERTEPHRPPAPSIAVNSSADPRDRASYILGVGTKRTPPLRLTLKPNDAADMIIKQLAEWS